MPENEASIRAFYDHEIDEPRATGRRRRQVADWGVGEDVFDRLPSRRFARSERRGEEPGEHHRAPRAEDAPPREDLARSEPRRPRHRPADDWLEEVSPRPAEAPETAARTIVIGGAVEEEIAPAIAQEEELSSEDVAPPRDEAPRPRRTIVICGHPDKLPAPRPRRPPKTALERVGASPDRLAAYAVGLGLLLILIAVLTTGH
jgi:hypothetical protein